MIPRSILGTLMAVGAALALGTMVGCTSPTPDYCDGNTPCKTPGTTCNLPTKTCVTTDGGTGTDGLVDGFVTDQPDAPLPNGSPCSADAHCENKHCVENVCCDSACDGICRTCKASSSIGTCVNAALGSDPRGSCAGKDPACNGSCDGSGGCDFTPIVDKACGASLCKDNNLTVGKCDSTGDCKQETQTCSGYICADGTGCKTSCTVGGSDCVAPAVCDPASKKCIATLADGQPCGNNNDLCGSKQCVDGFCCGTASCPECQSCGVSGQEGTCKPANEAASCGPGKVCATDELSTSTCKSGSCTAAKTDCAPYACNVAGNACGVSCSDDTECATNKAFCNKSSGTCEPKKANGVACSAGNECTSKQCVDTNNSTAKVCCDKACNGACETCSGKPVCTIRDQGSSCLPPVAATCKNDPFTSFISAPECNGTTSGCDGAKLTSCGLYRCGAGASCLTTCTQHSQCSSGVCSLWDVPLKSCVAPANICYVKAGATGGTGTQQAPYAAISSCLNGSKAFVAIANGTYSGDLTIPRPVVLIGYETPISLGKPQDDTLIKAIITPTPNGISVASPGGIVRIVGLQVKGSIGNPLISNTVAGKASIYIETSSLAESIGPAIVLSGVDIQLDDSVVRSCGAEALRIEAGNLTLKKVTLRENSGLAIQHESGAFYARDVNLLNNQAGILTYVSTVDIDRIVAAGQTQTALNFQSSTTGQIFNLAAVNNGGPGVEMSANSKVGVADSTFFRNNGTNAELVCNASTAMITNSIIWGVHDAINGAALSSCPTVTFSDTSVTTSGFGNISVDPKFVSTNPFLPDLHLQATSPCIDAGEDGMPASITKPTLDIEGNPRLKDLIPGGTSIDMGAYERQTP